MWKLFEKNINSKYSHFLLIIVLAIGFTLRLYKFDSPIADWHSWRQADTASVSRLYKENGIDLLYPKYHDLSLFQTGQVNPEGHRFVEFPLYNALHVYISFLPFLSFEEAGRLVSIFASLISTIIIFLISKRLYGINIGLLSAVFFSLLPFNIYYSRTILPEPLSVALILLGMYLYIKSLPSNNTYLFLSAVFVALGILVKPFVVFYILALIYLEYKKNNTVSIKRLSIFIIISFTPFLLWRVWMSQFPEGVTHTSWMFNSDGIRFRPSWFYWIFSERLGTLILGVWGTVIAVFGGIRSQRKNNFGNIFLASIVLFTIVFATANVRHDYYQIYFIPPISIILALGLSELLKKNWFVKALALFLVFLMFITSGTKVREYYKINHPEIVSAGTYIKENTPGDVLVVAPYNKDTAFLYQTGRRGWPGIDTTIEYLIDRGAEYYVSVNYDENTLQMMNKYNTVYSEEDFVVVELNP